MTPYALIWTAALLGLFVLAAGGYASLYCVGRLWARPALLQAARLCWVGAFSIAVAIAALTPLHAGWKLLILASAVVYAVIPPVTWRYLERSHLEEGFRP